MKQDTVGEDSRRLDVQAPVKCWDMRVLSDCYLSRLDCSAGAL